MITLNFAVARNVLAAEVAMPRAVAVLNSAFTLSWFSSAKSSLTK